MAKAATTAKNAKNLQEADRETLKKVIKIVGRDGWDLTKGVDYVDADDKKQKLAAKIRTELERFEGGYQYPVTDVSLIGYFNMTRSELGWTRPKKGNGAAKSTESANGEVTITEANKATALTEQLGGLKNVATALATIGKIEDQFGSLDRFRYVLHAVAKFRDDKDSLKLLAELY